MRLNRYPFENKRMHSHLVVLHFMPLAKELIYFDSSPLKMPGAISLILPAGKLFIIYCFSLVASCELFGGQPTRVGPA